MESTILCRMYSVYPPAISPARRLGGRVLHHSRSVRRSALASDAIGDQGPVLSDKLPLDTDNDLFIVNDSITPAVGEITHLSGRLLGTNGEPVRDAVVEIWQVDSMATYLQERGSKSSGEYDPNFQGFGRFLTSSTGEYYFRTIKPVPYPGRPAPHVHFMVKAKGREPWTHSTLHQGHPGNQTTAFTS